jgi:hypothetical protein
MEGLGELKSSLSDNSTYSESSARSRTSGFEFNY